MSFRGISDPTVTKSNASLSRLRLRSDPETGRSTPFGMATIRSDMPGRHRTKLSRIASLTLTTRAFNESIIQLSAR